MEAKAYLRYVRISPRKVQIVCDLIRGKDAKTAMAILMQDVYKRQARWRGIFSPKAENRGWLRP